MCAESIAYDLIACLVIASEQDSLDIFVCSYDSEKSLVCALHAPITSQCRRNSFWEGGGGNLHGGQN